MLEEREEGASESGYGQKRLLRGNLMSESILLSRLNTLLSLSRLMDESGGCFGKHKGVFPISPSALVALIRCNTSESSLSMNLAALTQILSETLSFVFEVPLLE